MEYNLEYEQSTEVILVGSASTARLATEKSKDEQIDSMLERYKDLSGHIRVKYVNPKSKPYFYKDYTDNAPTRTV